MTLWWLLQSSKKRKMTVWWLALPGVEKKKHDTPVATHFRASKKRKMTLRWLLRFRMKKSNKMRIRMEVINGGFGGVGRVQLGSPVCSRGAMQPHGLHPQLTEREAGLSLKVAHSSTGNMTLLRIVNWLRSWAVYFKSAKLAGVKPANRSSFWIFFQARRFLT